MIKYDFVTKVIRLKCNVLKSIYFVAVNVNSINRINIIEARRKSQLTDFNTRIKLVRKILSIVNAQQINKKPNQHDRSLQK